MYMDWLHGTLFDYEKLGEQGHGLKSTQKHFFLKRSSLKNYCYFCSYMFEFVLGDQAKRKVSDASTSASEEHLKSA